MLKKRATSYVCSRTLGYFVFSADNYFFVIQSILHKKKRKTRLLPKQAKENNYVIIEACTMMKVQGWKVTKQFLESRSSVIADGTIALFESAASSDDTSWEANINQFLATRNEQRIRLVEGVEPRFFRIGFDKTTDPVQGPIVSVIMPCFNCEETLAIAANSILNQSWKNIELIAIDDCSTDKTWTVLQDLAKRDSRIKILKLEINSGPYVAKNHAIHLASGDFITGHDSDDIAMPNRIERQMQPMMDGSGALASIGHMIRLDEQGCFSHPSRIGRFSYDGVVRKASISLCIRKDILMGELGFWDTARFGADSEMIARATILLGDKLVFQNELTMLCLDAAANLTNNPETGIRLATGISPVRVEYRDAWQAWHKATPIEQRKLPFPHVGQDRKFAIPEAMMVSDAAVDAIKTQVVLGDKLGKSDKVV